MLNDTYTLKNGMKIPKTGVGTWQVPDKEAAEVVCAALETGYCHIDTAAAYGNETGVGQGIRKSGAGRSGIFVTTKITADIKTYEGAKESIDSSLEKLGLKYIDLILIHAPRPWKEMKIENPKNYFEENVQVWKAMEEACRAGKVRSIGLSKCEIPDVENIIAHCDIMPAVNQIMVHIGHVPENVMEFCRKNGILIEAFSPIATGKLIQNAAIGKIAEKYGKSVPQLCIRYVLQKEAVALPKTTHREYMLANAQTDFEIAPEDMQALDMMKDPAGL